MEIYKQKTFDGRIINEQINTASDIIFQPLKYFYEKQNNRAIKKLSAAAEKPQIKNVKRTITDYYPNTQLPAGRTE